jgi:AraC-like DNA-binding protein
MDSLCLLAEGMPLRRLCERAALGLRFPAPVAEPLLAGFAELVADRGLARFGGLVRLLAAVAEAEGTPLARHWSPEADPADRRFARVLALIEERLDDLPTQPEIASAVGMTPAAFSRFFRRAAGRTFVAYLGHRRIAAACQDLLETEDRIIDIALRRGWQGLAAFNRRFRNITGRTPTDWRRLSRDPVVRPDKHRRPQ